MWIQRPRTAPFSLLVVFVLIAGCASPDASPPSAAPASVPGIRYSVEVLWEGRMWCDIDEIWLPDQRLACNVSADHARAFDAPAPRNRDRNGHERPTERCELPSDLVAEIVELARLTREQNALAQSLPARLLPLVPLQGLQLSGQ